MTRLSSTVASRRVVVARYELAIKVNDHSCSFANFDGHLGRRALKLRQQDCSSSVRRAANKIVVVYSGLYSCI